MPLVFLCEGEMASTNFQDYNENNPIVAAWLNDINAGVYTPAGAAKKAIQSSAAWVRFAVSGGVVTIQQSQNVSTVTRLSVGVYQITYSLPLTNAANCYEISMNAAGFSFTSVEAAGSVTIDTTNTSNTAFDPGFVSVVVHGAN
jgi:hypothetical protein